MGVLNPNNLPEGPLTEKLNALDWWARETELKGLQHSDGRTYHMHDVEFNRLIILALADTLGLYQWPADFQYWDDYGNLVPMTKEQALELGLTGALEFHDMKQRKRVVQQEILSAQDVDQLQQIDLRADRFDRPDGKPLPSPEVRVFSSLQFFGLFTDAEELAIETAGETDPKIRVFLRWATGANCLRLSDSRIAAGLDYLVTAGLLTAERKQQVMNGDAPA